jgi:hypothetical protein
MLMTVGWFDPLVCADAALITGVRVGAGVAELVSLAPGDRVTRVAAMPRATTAAAARAIVSGVCLRVRPRSEAALPPGLGRSGRLSMGVRELGGRECRDKMSLCSSAPRALRHP